jgi:hypothetical protein
MVRYRPAERPNAVTDTVAAIFVMPRYEIDPWLDLEAPASASPAVRALYRGLAVAGAMDRQAAVHVLANHPDRRALGIAEVLGILDRFPPEDPWEAGTDEAFLGLLRDIAHGARLAELVPDQLNVSTDLPPPAREPRPDDGDARPDAELTEEDMAAALLLMAAHGVLTVDHEPSPRPARGTWPARPDVAPGTNEGGR